MNAEFGIPRHPAPHGESLVIGVIKALEKCQVLCRVFVTGKRLSRRDLRSPRGHCTANALRQLASTNGPAPFLARPRSDSRPC